MKLSEGQLDINYNNTNEYYSKITKLPLNTTGQFRRKKILVVIR